MIEGASRPTVHAAPYDRKIAGRVAVKFPITNQVVAFQLVRGEGTRLNLDDVISQSRRKRTTLHVDSGGAGETCAVISLDRVAAASRQFLTHSSHSG